MINSNSLAAFAQQVGGAFPATPVRGPGGVQPGVGQPAQASASQRTLDAVPPPPTRPLPRGSLLDLKV